MLFASTGSLICSFVLTIPYGRFPKLALKYQPVGKRSRGSWKRVEEYRIINTGLFIIPWHITKKLVHLNGAKDGNIPVERETLQVYFAYLINALCVLPLWRGSRQGDNPLPPIRAAASHDRFLRWRFAIHRYPSRWNFLYHCFVVFFTGGSFPNLVRKRRCTVTIDCFRAHSSTQNAFSARVAIFTQPAPLAATDVTKHPRQVQTLREFLFLPLCRMLPSLAPFKCTVFFCNVSGNYE
jgi:hypothetical protein